MWDLCKIMRGGNWGGGAGGALFFGESLCEREINQKINLKIIQKLMGCARRRTFLWGVVLRARNLSKSIKNQTESAP